MQPDTFFIGETILPYLPNLHSIFSSTFNWSMLYYVSNVNTHSRAHVHKERVKKCARHIIFEYLPSLGPLKIHSYLAICVFIPALPHLGNTQAYATPVCTVKLFIMLSGLSRVRFCVKTYSPLLLFVGSFVQPRLAALFFMPFF